MSWCRPWGTTTIYHDSVYMCECTPIWTWAILSSHSSDSVSLKITVILSYEPLAHHCITLWLHEKHGNRECITLYVVLITYHYSPCLLFYYISERVKCVISCYCPSNVIHIVYIYIYITLKLHGVYLTPFFLCNCSVHIFYCTVHIITDTSHLFMHTHTPTEVAHAGSSPDSTHAFQLVANYSSWSWLASSDYYC